MTVDRYLRATVGKYLIIKAGRGLAGVVNCNPRSFGRGGRGETYEQGNSRNAIERIMGHSRIGRLPATRAWKEVVRLIADGADIGVVANATRKAAELAFAWVQKDPGFLEDVHLLTQLALAGGTDDASSRLAAAGLSISETSSLAEVAQSVIEILDRRIDASRQRSDFSEMTVRAIVGAITTQLQERLPTLFEPSREAVTVAFKGLSKKAAFGEMTKSFFANLTNESLDYFLSKNLATHLGEGRRFPTTNQQALFETAMRTHCSEVAEIVREFGADWFSKRRYEEKDNISRESAEGFGWYAMQKIRAELEVRAKNDEQ